MSRQGTSQALDIGPLSWVIDEVRASLGNSIAALKAFAGNSHDATQLKYAKTHLHQAHGALQIVDLDGISLITEEAERLLERFDADANACDAAMVSLVEHAFGGLLDYLDDLLAGSAHQPIRLYPHYRDLLKAVHADRIHPADLLFVDTNVRVADDAQPETVEPERLAAARVRFERGLLQFLRDVNRDAGVNDMAFAVRTVRSAQPRGAGRSFWTVMDGLLETLAVPGAVGTDLNLKRLCARMNLQMRRTIEGSGALAERLLKDALFYVAVGSAPTPMARRVREAFALENAVPRDYETTRYGRVDTQLIKRAKDQLSGLKAAWDRLMGGQTTEAASFQRQTQLFSEVAAQLGEPALDEIARALAEIGNGVAQTRALPAAAVGMEAATAVLFVENTLESFNRLDAQFPERARLIADRLRRAQAGQPVDESVEWLAEISRRSHERATMSTLVAEIQANLRAIEQTLDAFFRDQNKRDGLATTIPLIDQTAGALLLLDHQTANAALEFGRAAILRFQQPGYAADQREFERVAQSFGALGFFVDALRQPDGAARPVLEFDAHEGAFIARMTGDGAAEENTTATVPELGRTFTRTVATPTQATQPKVDADGFPTLDLPVDEHARTQIADFAEEARLSAPPPDDDVPLLMPEIEFDMGEPVSFDRLDVTSVERETQERTHSALAAFDAVRAAPHDEAARAKLRDELTELRQGAELLDNGKLVSATRNALAMLSGPLDDAGLSALATTLGELRQEKPIKEAPAPDASTLALAASDDAVIDAELLSIFLGEAREVFETIDTAREKAMASPSNQEHLTTLRRAFHTLKGSSRMVGLRVFGEAAWAVEQVFNLWLSEERAGTPAVFALAGSAREQMAEWVERIEAGEHRAVRPEALIAAAERVKAGEDFFLGAEAGGDEPPVSATTTPDIPDAATAAEDLEQAAIVEATLAEQDLAPEIPSLNTAVIDIPTITLDESGAETHATAAPLEPAAPVQDLAEPEATTPAIEDDVKRIGDFTISAQLYDIYLAEADDRLGALEQEFAAWRHEPTRVVTERAVRSAHSLSGSSATAGVGPVHDVANFLERVLVAVERAPVEVAPEEFDKLDYVLDRLRAMLHQFAAGIFPLVEPGVMAAIDELRVAWQMRQQTPLQLVAVPPMAQTVIDPMAGLDLSKEPSSNDEAPIVLDDLLADGALIDDLAITLPSTLDGAHEADIAAETIEAAPAEPAIEVAAVVEPETVIEAAPVIDIEPIAEAQPPLTIAPEEMPSIEAPSIDVPGTEALQTETPGAEVPDAEVMSAVAGAAEEDETAHLRDEIDPELFELFAAEAGDYLPRIGDNLRSLIAEPGNEAALSELLRGLHTVKGSARMAGAMRLGARLHDMETRAEVAHEQPSAVLYESLLARFDDAVAAFEALLQTGGAEPAAAAPTAEPLVAEVAPEPEPVPAPVVERQDPTATLPALRPSRMAAAVSNLGEGALSIVPEGRASTLVERQRAKSGALVRVKSEVLDRLVNQAGEVAIARSRLENDISGVRGSLGELTENVGRLRMQLREIEIAAEAQMQSRLEAQRQHAEEFDPLEFDRYTRLQELTRMMAESVNDVAMVQQNIVRSLEGAGKDLTSQARLTRDLQQDLMRVRMVPVDSVSDRLYRVVRQSAKETGKRVALGIVGGNVELDRGVLERMVGPFEHVLRNAVVHGIESKTVRTANGKAEGGNITLTVRYEGNEVLIEFVDDGAGLDLARIRERAAAHGLLAAPDAATDAEAAALIFQPGFSTASEITELAGRGVGMDVVRSEAGALGGRVEVETAAGRGTRFSIRLPLTLAVTQVVLVRAGGRIYALPSVLIEQVQQLRPAPLATAYNDGSLSVLGERVEFVYLPFLLGDHVSVPVAQRYSPIVALRSGGRRVALHVDEVIGNQEVVVKNIGPQLARMIGIAGATVLGSGDIVLILDPVQLVGRVQLQRTQPALSATGAVGEIVEGAKPPRTDVGGMSHAPVVMVVDDSVTVRRVTQRLLLRERYQVVLAKDGVDALEQMQDFAPDIMLVDIEMPRMDGFDLTRNVRSDPRYKDVPIVMITSRTADKHRNMAMALGVNVYLGKPYQEEELLATIRRFVGEHVQDATSL